MSVRFGIEVHENVVHVGAEHISLPCQLIALFLRGFRDGVFLFNHGVGYVGHIIERTPVETFSGFIFAAILPSPDVQIGIQTFRGRSGLVQHQFIATVNRLSTVGGHERIGFREQIAEFLCGVGHDFANGLDVEKVVASCERE